MTRPRRSFNRREKESLAAVAGYRCEACGETLTEARFEGDHRVPFSRGGATTLENGQALCTPCNRKKGAALPAELIAPELGASRTQRPRAPLPAPSPVAIPGFNDRRSQVGFMDAFVKVHVRGGKRNFLAEMGTGSGKTACGISAARYLFDLHAQEMEAGIPLELRRGARLTVVITASTAVRSEWEREMRRLASFDADLAMRLEHPMGYDWSKISGAMSFPADGTVILASPQSLQTTDIRNTLKLMIHRVDGEVAVIIDEVHHYADSNTWGAQLHAATQGARTMCGLSGTPYRHDDGVILGLHLPEGEEITPDYRYSKSAALADGVVARLFFRAVEGNICESICGTGEVVREGLLSGAEGRSGDEFLRIALAKGSTTLNTCIEQGIASLETARRETSFGPAPAGAIQCASVDQLLYIRDFLEARGYRVETTYSGDEEKASDVIDRFRSGAGDWILGLKRLTEGVNIPRLRVGVYVNHNLTTMQAFEQFCGRIERLVPGLAPFHQNGVIIIPKFWKFANYARQYEAEVKKVMQAHDAPVCECGYCGASIPTAVNYCPYCDAKNLRFGAATPWYPSADSRVIETEVTQTAFLDSIIHQAMTLEPQDVPVFAEAYDTRCREIGVPGFEKLSLEDRAFRELLLRRRSQDMQRA